MSKRFVMIIVTAVCLHSGFCFSMANTNKQTKMVPDTLDLSQRGKYALNALSGTVDPDNHCEFLFGANFVPPSVRHDAYSFSACGPKYIESWAMMRVMTGSKAKMEMQECATDYMMNCLGDDGMFYNIIGPERPWDISSPEDWANIYGQARMLRAMLALYQVDNDPIWLERMKKLVDTLKKIAVYKDDYAYYPTTPGYGDIFSYPRSGWKTTELITTVDSDEIFKTVADVPDHSFGIPLYLGGLVEPLCNYYKLTNDKETLDLAGKLVTFLLKPESGWEPDAYPQGIVPQEHGWFYGHFHGHTLCLRGILEYANTVNDMKLKNLVKDGYHYARAFGIVRLGWFHEYTGRASHETCGLANMTALAAKLTNSGVGDYWEDLDCYARNQLAESQFLDMVPARKANEDLNLEEAEILDRLQGSFSGWGKPNYIAPRLMNCCMANGSQALYYIWDNIVHSDGNGNVKVNLLLNRTSPVVDIESHLPYAGNVFITNKKAKHISVRIPIWVDRSKIKASINGRKVAYRWLGNYMIFDSLKHGRKIGIKFPMETSVEKYPIRHYKHRTTEFLGETEYTIRFKGNTAIDISPKEPNAIYPTYQREYYLQENAPMKETAAYVSTKTIKW